MNYLEEQTDGETMINSIKNVDQPLPRVTQVSIARTTSTEQPPLKGKSMWSAQEKRFQKIDRLARSLLIQGLPNDIYSLIDSNKTAKDLWDALARHMLGSEYGEQDRKAAVLFMNYLKEQMDEEAMINCIKHGDQPLPRVTQVSIAGTSSIEQPPLKDKSMWSDQEKKIPKIDRLIRSLLIQGLPNDIYSLIDSNKIAKDLWDALARHMLGFKYKIAKDLWDALARHMLGFKYGEQDRKVAVFKNLMDINIDALYNILKQNQGDVNDAMGLKKKTVMVTSDPLALIAEKTKITALLANDFNRRKFYSKPTNNNLRTSSVSQSANKKQEKKVISQKIDYEYYKTKMLLMKKDKDEQVLLTEEQTWMKTSSDSDQEINANMVFMAQIEKVISDSEASSSSADNQILEVSYYLSESESESEYETSEYYDNTSTYGLFVNDNDDQ
nr:RNA-directed DNA polymerase, eukaryota [Tanacetum cinerariifolium]